MSKCKNCYFHRTGYLYNSCGYFECKYYSEPDDCLAFSEDGNLSTEVENQIYNETGGAFGEPLFNKPNFTNHTGGDYPN